MERIVLLVPAFLAGCHIAPLGERDAHAAGRLLGKSRTADVVDASVVAIAIRYQAAVITSDVEDMERLAAVADARVGVVGL